MVMNTVHLSLVFRLTRYLSLNCLCALLSSCRVFQDYWLEHFEAANWFEEFSCTKDNQAVHIL